jgi:multiple sugar transport system permease protein
MTATDVGPAAAPRRDTRPKTRAKPKHAGSAYLLIAPFMVVFLAMFLAPLVYSLYLSLYSTQLVGGTTFVGLANYAEALTDPRFLSGMGRIVRFFFLQVPIMLVLATIFALILDSGRLHAPKLFRIAFFLPYAVPSVVAALMWGYLYGARFGPFAQIADWMGTTAPGFLTATGLLPSIANIVTWSFVGYNMITLYAALRSIPTELYEAASMDGAGAIRTAWSIKLPLLRPALGLVLLFSIIGAFQLFNEPSVLRPVAGSAITPSWTPNLYAYTLAFTDQRINYAAAISFLLGFVILAGTYLVLALSRVGRKQTS